MWAKWRLDWGRRGVEKDVFVVVDEGLEMIKFAQLMAWSSCLQRWAAVACAQLWNLYTVLSTKSHRAKY